MSSDDSDFDFEMDEDSNEGSAAVVISGNVSATHSQLLSSQQKPSIMEEEPLADFSDDEDESSKKISALQSPQKDITLDQVKKSEVQQGGQLDSQDLFEKVAKLQQEQKEQEDKEEVESDKSQTPEQSQQSAAPEIKPTKEEIPKKQPFDLANSVNSDPEIAEPMSPGEPNSFKQPMKKRRPKPKKPEDPFQFKSAKVTQIPVLNKETANPLTYDIDQLLDPKTQKQAKALHRFSNNDPSKSKNLQSPKTKSSPLKTQPPYIPSKPPTRTIDSPTPQKRAGNIKFEIMERSAKYKEHIQEKINKLTEKLKQDQMQECTFLPKVNTEGRRSFEEFLYEVYRFNKNKKENIATMREEKAAAMEEQLANMKFTINERSDTLASRHEREGSVHQRLFENLKTEAHKRIVQLIKQGAQLDPSTYTFSPQVSQRSRSIRRTESIDKLLYDDAIRRRNYTPERPRGDVKLMSNRSQNLLMKKFTREFNDIWVGLDVQEKGDINYVQLGILLRDLHFIEENDSEERSLLVKLWKLVAGPEAEFIKRENIFRMLCCIMNFPVPEQDPPSDGYFGCLVNGQFAFSKKQALNISTAFSQFGKNRARFEQTRPRIKAGKQDDSFNYSFRPSILDSTYRIERSQSIDARITNVLMHERQRILEQRETAKKMKDEEEAKMYSFKPKIIEMPKSSMYKSIDSVSDDRSSDKRTVSSEYRKILQTPTPKRHRAFVLYELASYSKQRRHEIIRSFDDVDLERNIDECTFTPDITQSKTSRQRQQEPKVQIIPGVDGVLQRLRRAREENQRIRKMTEQRYSDGEFKAMTFGLGKIDQNSTINTSMTSVSSKQQKRVKRKRQRKIVKKPLKFLQEFETPDIRTIETNVTQHEEEEEEEAEDESDDGDIVISVNLAPDVTENIRVKPGEDVDEVIKGYIEKHDLDESQAEKLLTALKEALQGAVEEEIEGAD